MILRRAARAELQPLVEIESSGAESWSQAEGQADSQRCYQREREDTQIHAYVFDARNCRREMEDRLEGDGNQRKSSGASGHAQKRAFSEQLPDQALAAGSERGADGDLALAGK